jgi:hypothetical protein
MSREIVRAIIEDRLKELRKFSYGALVKLVGQVSCDRVNGPDGGEYQVETETRWDSEAGGDVRVIAAVGGPGTSTFRPLTGTFIIFHHLSSSPGSKLLDKFVCITYKLKHQGDWALRPHEDA